MRNKYVANAGNLLKEVGLIKASMFFKQLFQRVLLNSY